MAAFNLERQARNFIKSQVAQGPKKAPQNRQGLQPIRSIGTERRLHDRLESYRQGG